MLLLSVYDRGSDRHHEITTCKFMHALCKLMQLYQVETTKSYARFTGDDSNATLVYANSCTSMDLRHVANVQASVVAAETDLGVQILEASAAPEATCCSGFRQALFPAVVFFFSYSTEVPFSSGEYNIT